MAFLNVIQLQRYSIDLLNNDKRLTDKHKRNVTKNISFLYLIKIGDFIF